MVPKLTLALGSYQLIVGEGGYSEKNNFFHRNKCLPKIPYNSKIILSSSKFDKILGDVQVVSDYLTINTSDSNANFSGKGDSGEVTIDLEKDDDNIEEITSQEDSTGTYSLEYLNPVVKAVGSTAGFITCEFSSAKPLRIEFKVANIGRIHFYLAPRVES